MNYVKKLLNDVKALSEAKMEKVSEIITDYSHKLNHKDKKDFEYALACEIYGHKLTMNESEYIVDNMYNEKRSGKIWSPEQVKSVATSKGIEMETDVYSFADLYAVIHSMRYDHCNYLNSISTDEAKIAEHSLMLALGFLNDFDAIDDGLGKARRYYHYVA